MGSLSSHAFPVLSVVTDTRMSEDRSCIRPVEIPLVRYPIWPFLSVCELTIKHQDFLSVFPPVNWKDFFLQKEDVFIDIRHCC